MKAWPLRWKLTLWSALVTGLALLTFGLGAAISLYHVQVEDVDDRLEAQAKLFYRRFPAEAPLAAAESAEAASLFKASGEVRDFAWGAPRRPEFVSSPRIEPLLTGWPQLRRKQTSWHDERLVRTGVFTRGGRLLVLVASQKPIQEMLADLTGTYLAALPIVLLVVGGGSWWLARRALQPIAAMTRDVSAITASRLDLRLSAPPIEDEVGQHVRVLNAMFDRLQASFEQANRFTADASHELRTPLTILRGEIEEALHSGPNAHPAEKLLLSLLEQTGALQKIADNLLLLARFDAGKLPLQRMAVDFSELVAVAAEDAGMLAAPAGIEIEANLAAAIEVDGDAVLLRRVLLNLIDNAVRYNRPSGRVKLTLQFDGASAGLRVGNTGPGIPAERQPALFQRFFRADEDRNRGTGGTGLGLSLCREIITAHGGTISLVQSEPDNTEFLIRLPGPGAGCVASTGLGNSAAAAHE